MRKDIFYIPESLIQFNNAASKAREDIDTILRCSGLRPLLSLNIKSWTTKVSKFKLSYWRFLYYMYTTKNKRILLQYPHYGRIIRKAFDCLTANNNIIFFVHDLEYLRFDNTKQQLYYEVALLNKADVVVSHNSVMTRRMRQDGVVVPIVELELFDYLLSDVVPEKCNDFDRKVVFAGNLAKSDFLKKEAIQNMDFKLELYGSGFSETAMGWKNVHYAGSFKPNEVPYKLQGSFGLIWDGTSVDTCDGRTGEYMRYNNPHKLSLYIVSVLPVIVWEEAAIAELVKKYQIGLTVSSLHEISDKIQGLSNKEYKRMVDNVKKLQGKLAKGYFTKKALAEVVDILSNTKS